MVENDDIDLSQRCIIVALQCERDHWNDNFSQNLEGEEQVFEAISTDGNGKPLSATVQEKVKIYHRERLLGKLVLQVGARLILLKTFLKKFFLTEVSLHLKKSFNDPLKMKEMKPDSWCAIRFTGIALNNQHCSLVFSFG